MLRITKSSILVQKMWVLYTAKTSSFEEISYLIKSMLECRFSPIEANTIYIFLTKSEQFARYELKNYINSLIFNLKKYKAYTCHANLVTYDSIHNISLNVNRIKCYFKLNFPYEYVAIILYNDVSAKETFSFEYIIELSTLLTWKPRIQTTTLSKLIKLILYLLEEHVEVYREHTRFLIEILKIIGNSTYLVSDRLIGKIVAYMEYMLPYVSWEVVYDMTHLNYWNTFLMMVRLSQIEKRYYRRKFFYRVLQNRLDETKQAVSHSIQKYYTNAEIEYALICLKSSCKHYKYFNIFPVLSYGCEDKSKWIYNINVKLRLKNSMYMNSYIARLWDFFCYSNQRMDVKSVVETARLLDQYDWIEIATKTKNQKDSSSNNLYSSKKNDDNYLSSKTKSQSDRDNVLFISIQLYFYNYDVPGLKEKLLKIIHKAYNKCYDELSCKHLSENQYTLFGKNLLLWVLVEYIYAKIKGKTETNIFTVNELTKLVDYFTTDKFNTTLISLLKYLKHFKTHYQYHQNYLLAYDQMKTIYLYYYCARYEDKHTIIDKTTLTKFNNEYIIYKNVLIHPGINYTYVVYNNVSQKVITCVDIMLNMRNKMKFKEFDDKVSREWLKMEEEISKLTVWSRWKSLLVKGLFEANYIGVERYEELISVFGELVYHLPLQSNIDPSKQYSSNIDN